MNMDAQTHLILGRFMTRPNCAPLAGLGILLGIVMLGCGGGDDGGGGTPPPTTTITKTSTSGDLQSGTVGQALTNPLEVVVTEDGVPVSGRTVTWATTASGGSVDPTTAATDADGVATTTWTLGTASGSQSASATLSGASGSPVTFTATAAPAAAASLSEQSGDQQSAEINTPLPAPVEAKVSDQFGNGVPGVAVDWAATGGSVSAATVLTNDAGISGVNVTAGGAEGPITITASAAGLSGSPLTFTATATPPAPTGNTVSVVNNSFSPSTLTVTAGTEVVWTWAPGAIDHNVRPAGTEPPRSGDPVNAPMTYRHTFNTPGTYIYFCEVHGSTTFGMRGTIIVQ
jgi:plastocyanin